MLLIIRRVQQKHIIKFFPEAQPLDASHPRCGVGHAKQMAHLGGRLLDILVNLVMDVNLFGRLGLGSKLVNERLQFGLPDNGLTKLTSRFSIKYLGRI